MKNLLATTFLALLFISPAAAEPTGAPQSTTIRKVALQNGDWAEITPKQIKTSKDNGKTWVIAPDGVYEPPGEPPIRIQNGTRTQ